MQNTQIRSEKENGKCWIITSVLIIAGSTLGSADAHVPDRVSKAPVEVVNSYIKGAKYNPYKSERDWNTSEERRKLILKDIAGIRSNIRRMAKDYRNKYDYWQDQLIQEHNIAGKLIDSITA